MFFQRHSREVTVAGALVLLMVTLAVFTPHFFDLQPFLSRLTSQMPALVAAIGIALVIICRQIDISIGAQFSMCAIIAGVAANAGLPLPVVVLTSIAAGASMGAFNGFFVAWMGLPSIVVTLATMVAWQEVLRLWQQGRMLALPAGIQWFGLSQAAGQALVITLSFALLIAAAWAMRNLSIGRFIYATGSDAEAARLAGIDPKRTTFGVFIGMGDRKSVV